MLASPATGHPPRCPVRTVARETQQIEWLTNELENRTPRSASRLASRQLAVATRSVVAACFASPVRRAIVSKRTSSSTAQCCGTVFGVVPPSDFIPLAEEIGSAAHFVPLDVTSEEQWIAATVLGSGAVMSLGSS